MIKNVIFDWSGTLCNDLLEIYKACMIVFEKFGVEKISLEEYKREVELPYMNFYWKYIPGLDKDEQDRVYAEAIKTVGKSKIYEGVRETLHFLKKKGINMAVLSSSPRERIEYEINNFNLGGIFSCIFADVHDKRDAVEELMEKCNFEKEETLYVGDIEHDVDTGKHAGITTVAITWGYCTKDRLEKSNPDYMIDKIEQLKEIITSA